MGYKIIFELERIYFVKLTKELIPYYLEMINNGDIQKNIGKKRIIYTYEQELEWVFKNL